METLLDAWNTLKKLLTKRNRTLFCKPREVWWCSLGVNVGGEIYGKGAIFERPVLILSIFNHEMIFVIPLTSQKKHFDQTTPIEFNNKISYGIFSQMRAISTKRLSRKIKMLPKETFESIRASCLEKL